MEKNHRMKTIILSGAILFSVILSACQNPFFIESSGMYKVDFETNGGSSVSSLRTDKIKVEPKSDKEGYTFAGWFKNSECSGASEKFPLSISGDTILYAKWNTNFTVLFESNGGSEVDPINASCIEVMPESHKNGFIFGGWYSTPDYSTVKTVFPFTVTRNTTLYARWLTSFNVQFVTNGGTPITTYRAAEISISPVCTKAGYDFAGWYFDSSLTVPAEFPLILTADTTLYAKWQRIYSINFVTNGGTSVQTMQTSCIQSSPQSTKTDASLEGWYTDEGCTSGNKVTFPYTVSSDITLYAKWQAIQCTITYMPNGATSGTVPASVTVDKGSTYTISTNSGNLAKTGYAFTKWNSKTDGSGQGYSAGSTITVTKNITLYVQWGLDYSEMITVPGGWFYFGDPSSSSRPKITLSSFQIAKYELTYELWQEVSVWANNHGYNLTAASKGYAANDQYKSFVPATNFSWNMACVWLNAYSEYKGFEPVYYRGSAVWKDDTNTNSTFSWDQTKNGFRLPTECEWEFAAGGGDAETHDAYTYAGSNTIGNVAWYSSNSGGEAHTVGTKQANSLGIYDMSGNVREWCYDRDGSFGTGELTNPIHQTGNYLIYRGGTVTEDKNYYTKIYYRTRDGQGSSARIQLTGIRIARNAE